jgi:hypothetical protein
MCECECLRVYVCFNQKNKSKEHPTLYKISLFYQISILKTILTLQIIQQTYFFRYGLLEHTLKQVMEIQACITIIKSCAFLVT